MPPFCALVRARVEERLLKLRFGAVAQRLDGILSQAARSEPTYLDFLDQILTEETETKQKKRVAMGITIAHFPAVKTLEDFDFKFQPSIDQKLVRELATGRFIANAENVLLFGPPGVGKTHLAIALGRAAVESGHSAAFVTATALLAQLSRAQAEGKLADQIAFYAKPKLLVVDELGCLPLEKQTAHLFFQLVSRRYERGSMLLTTNQTITQWGHVFGDEMIATAVLDRVLHHSGIATFTQLQGPWILWTSDAKGVGEVLATESTTPNPLGAITATQPASAEWFASALDFSWEIFAVPSLGAVFEYDDMHEAGPIAIRILFADVATAKQAVRNLNELPDTRAQDTAFGESVTQAVSLLRTKMKITIEGREVVLRGTMTGHELSDGPFGIFRGLAVPVRRPLTAEEEDRLVRPLPGSTRATSQRRPLDTSK